MSDRYQPNLFHWLLYWMQDNHRNKEHPPIDQLSCFRIRPLSYYGCFRWNRTYRQRHGTRLNHQEFPYDLPYFYLSHDYNLMKGSTYSYVISKCIKNKVIGIDLDNIFNDEQVVIIN